LPVEVRDELAADLPSARQNHCGAVLRRVGTGHLARIPDRNRVDFAVFLYPGGSTVMHTHAVVVIEICQFLLALIG
jgi:hypothetical protein